MTSLIQGSVPNHVAIVMDGNGRWAAQRGLARIDGHRAGIKSVKSSIKSCLENGVKILSLFAFSSENWNRPAQEVRFLMSLFLESLRDEIDTLHEQGIRLCFCGDRCKLSVELQQTMNDCEEKTLHNEQLILNVAVNYGGKWDIVEAAKHIARDVLANTLELDTIDESCFSNYLDTHPLPAPDLFIRTSGEKRVSNFFLWQLAYAELFFSPKCWPDFDEQSFKGALHQYGQRERRYGLTSKQIEDPHV